MADLDEKELDDLLEDTLGEFSDEIAAHPGTHASDYSFLSPNVFSCPFLRAASFGGLHAESFLAMCGAPVSAGDD